MAAEGRLLGLKAIVTGAAQGIGEAIARALAHEGTAVAIADVNLSGAQQVASEIEASGGSALAMKVDVSSPQEVARMVEAVLGRWNAVDLLVNNAGGHRTTLPPATPAISPLSDSPGLLDHSFTPFTAITGEEWDQVMALNLRSVFFCCQAVSKQMMERRTGRIINIASSGAVHPRANDPSYIPYAAAKGGVITFTKHLAMELGPYGITVNSISPGTALTPRVLKRRGEESIRMAAERNPLKHLIEPRDVAEAVVFLASEGGRYITGINLNVNAGSIMV
jgi:NAD(P)-dependent dehydrogenase (short-subunit alcohol dehydrogenase family)